jgi:UDP-N-acetylglucosamine--N-acetylmuramyl-(pentapeptide) pyrophosphoryl-undecaprenol N-acetylglucosamine transferase
MHSIILAGGGTAGHIMPNLALIPELRKRFDRIYYMGGADSLEEKITSDHGIEFFTVEVVKLRRDKIFSNLDIPFKLLKGIKSAKKIMKELSPEIVFLKGGYASLPVAYAAKLLRIPVICHESDMTLGLANKLISAFSEATFISFPETKARNAVYTGTPVRDWIKAGDKDKLMRELGLPRRPTVLVMGGSQGSKAINQAIAAAAPELVKKFNILHLTGRNKIAFTDKYYKSVEFATNIEDYFALADIVVSRAGATSLAELNSLNKKMILIPLPKGGASRGDQELNAAYYAKSGAAYVIRQENLSKESLISAINYLYDAPSPKRILKSASNVEIVDLISKYCKR